MSTISDLGTETTGTTPLVKEITCPNCWERYAPERSVYIATHPELYGDLLLGETAQRRFLPTRFHPDGRALDPKGSPCNRVACPKCHLSVPRVLLERPTLFTSIFGSPKSGKSYLLAAMTHQLRKTFPKSFSLNFSDADPEANAILHGYEDTLFSGADAEALVQIAKTGEVGDWYQTVRFGTKEISYPKPFFFQISPVAGHPRASDAASVSRTLCLYDNAGESFQPGADLPNNPVTQHMAKAHFLLFVYDPTQEPEFRKVAKDASSDPQMKMAVTSRQEVLLAEAARRVKTYRGLAMTSLHDKPLIVLVNKYDAWQKLVSGSRLEVPWTKHNSGDFSVLRIDTIQKASSVIRNMLKQIVPQVVSTAESFVDPARILYLPVSATGGPPTPDKQGNLRHRVGDLRPMWAEVPLLYVISQHVNGLIPFQRPAESTPDPSRKATT
jgi:hypothetical protein